MMNNLHNTGLPRYFNNMVTGGGYCQLTKLSNTARERVVILYV